MTLFTESFEEEESIFLRGARIGNLVSLGRICQLGDLVVKESTYYFEGDWGSMPKSEFCLFSLIFA
jgi:hypothetical protein